MALATQTIAMSWGNARLEEGISLGRLQSEYFNLLKQSGSVFTGRAWSSATAAWSNATNRWTSRSLEKALAALLDADVSLKESRVSSEEQVIATLVLSMCIEDDRSVAA
jgi:DNA polymerase-3 subunit delta